MVSLGAAGLAAWWLWGREAAPHEARAIRQASAPSLAPRPADPWAVPDEAALEAPAQPPPIPSAGISDPAARAAAVAKLDQTLAIYRETMVYPLSSRPADGSNAHLTRWNHPIDVTERFAVDAAKREIQAFAQIDRTFAAPGEPVSVLVATSYVDDGAPAMIDEIRAELQWRDRQADEGGNAWVTVQAIPLRPDAEGWRGAVAPSQLPALRAQVRETRVLAYVRRGDFARELALDFAYAVEAPVIVHGLASDRVAGGSLELGLDVELATAAPVALTATLFAASGAPIAVFDDRYFPRQAGRQVIPVSFFGKILHDRGVDGPYRLGAIHGYVYRRDLEPDQLRFDHPDAPALTTGAYAAAAFSAAPYQSPEVAARIAHYEAVREALREGREPPPPPSRP